MGAVGVTKLTRDREHACDFNHRLDQIKEWQAIMDHLHNFPVKNRGELPAIPTDERTRQVRAIQVG